MEPALKQNYLIRARVDWQIWQEECAEEQAAKEAQQEEKDRGAARALAAGIFGEAVVLRDLPDPDNMVFVIPGENIVLLYVPQRWDGHGVSGNRMCSWCGSRELFEVLPDLDGVPILCPGCGIRDFSLANLTAEELRPYLRQRQVAE